MFALKFFVSRSLRSPNCICICICNCNSSLSQSYLDFRVFPLRAPSVISQNSAVVIASIMLLTSLLVMLALFSLNPITHAFPLKSQAPPKQRAVRRRVEYSVVAVDGGSVATPPAAPGPDVITLLQTSDSIETVTVPASSTPQAIESIVATKIVSELEPAETMDIIVTHEITTTPSPTTVASYIVVNPMETPTSSSQKPIKSQTFTSVSSSKCVTSFSTSTLILSLTSTWTSISTSTLPLANSNRTSDAAHLAEAKDSEGKDPKATALVSSSPLPPPHAGTSVGNVPTASTKTYDNGMWHTSYPVWNSTSTILSSVSATASGTGTAQTLLKKG